MILQCFSDATLITESGTRLYGPGELVTLPIHEAVKVMNLASDHFKIVKPTPLLPGVTVCWILPDDRVQGPGIVVQLVDGSPPDRRLSVLIDGALCWIKEQVIVDINPWPAIDAKLEEACDHAISEGEESPKVLEVREWLCTHFDEDKDPWMR
jgi:hypothetical protein